MRAWTPRLKPMSDLEKKTREVLDAWDREFIVDPIKTIQTLQGLDLSTLQNVRFHLRARMRVPSLEKQAAESIEYVDSELNHRWNESQTITNALPDILRSFNTGEKERLYGDLLAGRLAKSPLAKPVEVVGAILLLEADLVAGESRLTGEKFPEMLTRLGGGLLRAFSRRAIRCAPDFFPEGFAKEVVAEWTRLGGLTASV